MEHDTRMALLLHRQYEDLRRNIQQNLGNLISSAETVAAHFPPGHALGARFSSQDVLDSLIQVGRTPLHYMVDAPSSSIMSSAFSSFSLPSNTSNLAASLSASSSGSKVPDSPEEEYEEED